jgi:hypothetical protein
VIHSDGWKGYNGIVDFGYKKHFKVHHGKNEFARDNAHIKPNTMVFPRVPRLRLPRTRRNNFVIF